MKEMNNCALVMSVLMDELAYFDEWEPEIFYPLAVLEQAPPWATKLPRFLKYGSLVKGSEVIELGPDGDVWTVAYFWTR